MATSKHKEKTLLKHYDKIIEERKRTDALLESLSTLFNKNQTSIKTLIEKDKIIQKESREAIEAAHFAADKVTQETYEATQKKHDSTIKEQGKDLQETKAKAKELLEKKQSLNLLKEEKIKNDYQSALKDIEDNANKIRLNHDDTIEKATQTFYENTVQLDKENDLKISKIHNNFENKETENNKKLEEAKTKADQSFEVIDSSLSKLIDSYVEKHKNLVESYEAEIKPHEEKRKAAKKAKTSALNTLKNQQNKELAKNEKFKREQEKLKNKEETNKYEKIIKALKKDQEEALDKLTTEHDDLILEIETELNLTMEKYKKKSLEIIEECLEQILEQLQKKQAIKTDNLIETNTINIQTLIDKARLTFETNTQKIDYDLQITNFNQTLEEARLSYEQQIGLIKPNQEVEKEEKKRIFNNEKTNLKAKQDTDKIEYNHKIKISEIQQAIAQHKTMLEKNIAEQENQYQKELNAMTNQRNIIQKDFEKECNMTHYYYLQAKNYTALKNQRIESHGPEIKTIINVHINKQIDIYQTILKDAESDHKTIIDAITSTYEEQLNLYQTTIEEINNEHDKILKDFTNTLSKKHNKDLEAIEILDAKKDKQTMKKLEEELKRKKQQDKQKIAQKEKSLSERLILYNTMIEDIKQYKMHSVEEADTLLMHITDEVNATLNTLQSLEKKQAKAFTNIYKEIKKSADLFNTFQLQREETTVENARIYRDERLKRIEVTDAQNKNTLDKTIQALKQAHTTKLNILEQDIVETDTFFEKSLETIKETLEKQLNTIEEHAQNETKKQAQHIRKINHKYHEQAKQYINDVKNQKDTLFHKKEEAEKELHNLISRRENEATDYEQERYKILKEDIELYNENIRKLLTTLKKSQKDQFKKLNILHVVPHILGEKTIDLK